VVVLNDSGELDYDRLMQATEEVLESQCSEYLCKTELSDKENPEIDEKIAKFILDGTTRNSDGRLVMPLAWRAEVSGLLGDNFALARNILASNLEKLKNSPEKLELIEKVVKEQESLGIIEKISNLYEYIENSPSVSFLAHMPVF
jgi:hypothetical protein